ncbi:DUF3040 domain-containing protein [Pseudonocardia tropica]|uniref:DUF3040 family protein n=3 Tax=Pseudonocardia TaxID=1847 RepID=A0A4Q7V7P0_PSEST|nr:DUF3040 domain-containing protein [Pseudonocardia sediminis]RZT88779.1 DUF3040 family protein [Pseudonocardia sediminis]
MTDDTRCPPLGPHERDRLDRVEDGFAADPGLRAALRDGVAPARTPRTGRLAGGLAAGCVAVLVACLVAGPVAALAIALLGLVLLVVMLAACG